jgi:hypothetical protein
MTRKKSEHRVQLSDGGLAIVHDEQCPSTPSLGASASAFIAPLMRYHKSADATVDHGRCFLMKGHQRFSDNAA